MRMRIDMNANVLAQTVKPNRFIKMSVRWESILFGSLLFFFPSCLLLLLLAKKSTLQFAWAIFILHEWITMALHNISFLLSSSPSLSAFGFNFDFNRLARVYLCIAHEKKSISLLLCKFRLFNICCVACGCFLMGNKILIVSVVAMLRRYVAIILLLVCTTIT